MQPSAAPKTLALTDIEKIVIAYGEAMVSMRSMVADQSGLPYPKPVIKAALIAAISATNDAKMLEQLKSAFISLADWQEGIGPGPHVFNVTDKDLENPMATMKQIQANQSFTDVPARVAAEAQELSNELKALGL